MQDRDGAKAVLARLPELPRLAVIWADGAYAALIAWVRGTFGWVLATILRPVGVKGYVHLPRRWVVERTFGWLGRYRRLTRDYERLASVLAGWHWLAFLILAVKHVAPSA